MTSLLGAQIEEWQNGWSYRISGYIGNENGVCVTFKQTIKKIESYQRRAYREYMKDNPTDKIAK